MNKVIFIKSSLNHASVSPIYSLIKDFKVETINIPDFYLVRFRKPDLIIIDSPVYRNFYICKNLRREGIEVPIIGLSKSDPISEKVKALTSGMDDIIDIEISDEEFIAKVQSILRRPRNFHRNIIKLNNMEIDTGNRTIKRNRKHVALRRKEFDILLFLIKNQGKALSRDEIIENVWCDEEEPMTNTLDVHIRYIRKKIDQSNKFIKTVHGIGYKFTD